MILFYFDFWLIGLWLIIIAAALGGGVYALVKRGDRRRR